MLFTKEATSSKDERHFAKVGKLMRRYVQVLRQNLPVAACLIEHVDEVGILKDIRHFPGRKQIVG